MNKSEIIANVSDSANLTRKEVENVFDGFISAIQTSLAEGDKVTIAGFGTFEVKERAARSGRNPQTGETIVIPATKTVTFKPAKQLKDKFND